MMVSRMKYSKGGHSIIDLALRRMKLSSPKMNSEDGPCNWFLFKNSLFICIAFSFYVLWLSESSLFRSFFTGHNALLEMEKIKFDKLELFLGVKGGGGERGEERIMTRSQKQAGTGKDQFRRREDFVFCSSLARTHQQFYFPWVDSSSKIKGSFLRKRAKMNGACT